MRTLIFNPPFFDKGREGFIREGRCEQSFSSFQYVMEPISLLSIAAVLEKNNFHVKFLDCMVEVMTLEDIKNYILEYNPALIIVNVATATFLSDIKIIEAIKNFSLAHISAIGVHVSALPSEALKMAALDSVIRGEPELTALELAKAVSDKIDLNSVDGLSFRNEEEIKHNRNRAFCENLDSLPFPARGLERMGEYTLPVVNKPYTLIISSRGCPYNCIFCTAYIYYGRKLRLRSVSNIVEEIETVSMEFNVKYFTMWSDTFTLDKDFVVRFCDELLKRDLKIFWMCNSRADKVDYELLMRMKKSGCMGISFGVESGVQGILDNAEKNITISQIENAFRLCNLAGIQSLAHIIFGLPGETKKSINETIDFVIKIKPAYAQFYCAIPFPGTVFYRDAVKKGWLDTDDWSRFELNQSIISTGALSSRELSEARKKAYRKFYLRPSYIFSRLRDIKTLKNAILTLKNGVNFIKKWIC
ncbi:B12-binding domain-containing radical SAM protein [bacterium]|nr:radical SAM protein [bacterium]MBU3956618.1 B12-binding domain-containing radical SAM protein [bacterium]